MVQPYSIVILVGDICLLLVMPVVQCTRTYSTLLLPCGHFSWWTAQKPSVHRSVLHELTD